MSISRGRMGGVPNSSGGVWVLEAHSPYKLAVGLGRMRSRVRKNRAMIEIGVK